jgi:SAM-dependent methyltransferase
MTISFASASRWIFASHSVSFVAAAIDGHGFSSPAIGPPLIKMTPHPCGCLIEPDPASGVLRSVVKCPRHRAGYRDPETLDESYYAELGVIKDGRLQSTKHVEELTEALGEIPSSPDCFASALEIGAGVTPYGDIIESKGWVYLTIEPSRWAAEYLGKRYGRLSVMEAEFESVEEDAVFGLILAAHCFEHMRDAPGAIAKCSRLLYGGGELLIIVPDDSDPFNADHLWYFTPETLRATVEATGLVVERFAAFRRVKHETFLYVRARKPA